MAKVFAALPNMGWIETRLMLNLIPWLKAGIYVWAPSNVRPASFAYNTCVEAFLKTDYTHFWFLNADTIPPVDALKLLLEADKDIVCGITPTLKLDLDGEVKSVPMVCRRVGDLNFKPVLGEGLVPIDACGTACTMIKRELFEAVEAPWYEDRNWHGEMPGDFRFCCKAKEAGFEIFAHFDVRCIHRKEVDL